MTQDEGKAWATDWMFKRSIGDLDELLGLMAGTDGEIDLKQARAILVSARRSDKATPERVETTKDREPFSTAAEMDFRGKWRTASGKPAVVESILYDAVNDAKYWNGTVEGLPTYWNQNGKNPTDPGLDLVERIREGAYARNLF